MNSFCSSPFPHLKCQLIVWFGSDGQPCVFPLLTVSDPSQKSWVCVKSVVKDKTGAGRQKKTKTFFYAKCQKRRESDRLTNANWWVLIVVSVRLTHNSAGTRHAVTRVGHTVVFDHRSSYGRVGWKPEATVVDDGWFETVDGCWKTKRKFEMMNKATRDEPSFWIGTTTVCHDLLTFAARWGSVPSAINVADEIAATNHLIALIARVGDHAQIVSSIVDQLVATAGYPGRQTTLDVWKPIEPDFQRERRRRIEKGISLLLLVTSHDKLHDTYICIQEGIHQRSQSPCMF